MRKFFLSISFVVCAFPSMANAQLVISEIMYDLQTGADTGREWVEVFNASEDTVAITEWKVLEGGSNHAISAVQGGDSLPSGGYAIIADNPAKFLIDWPGYAGALFDTAFSGGLSNSGESIVVGYMENGALISTDTVTYAHVSGGAGDGMSLQRTESGSATFTGGAPTPGSGALVIVQGLHVAAPSTGNTGDTTDASTTPSVAENEKTPSNPVSSYVAPPEPLIYAYAGKDRDVIAGADVVYEGQAYDKKGAWLSASTTRFSWNFGDGNLGEGSQVRHHFNVPGTYAVVLNVANATNAAASKIVVNVHPVSIAMSERLGAIVLTNMSAFELDLSDWFFKARDVLFRLPKDTILLPRASAAFTASTTGILDATIATLVYPNGTMAAAIGTPSPTLPPVIAQQPTPAPISKKIKKSAPARVSTKLLPVEAPLQEPQEPEDTSSTTALTASAAIATDAAGSNNIWWFGAAALAIGGGAAASLISRSKKRPWDVEES